MRFHAIIQQSGKTATGIQVPAAVVGGLGTSKRPAVSVTINGYTYRSSIAAMGGVFMLPVSAEVRAGAGIAGGDQVDVEVELDTAPRQVTVPPDFTEALNQDGEAKRFFEALSYSNQLRLVLAVETAKAADTRQRRIDQTVAKLHEGRS